MRGLCSLTRDSHSYISVEKYSNSSRAPGVSESMSTIRLGTRALIPCVMAGLAERVVGLWRSSGSGLGAADQC